MHQCSLFVFINHVNDQIQSFEPKQHGALRFSFESFGKFRR